MALILVGTSSLLIGSGSQGGPARLHQPTGIGMPGVGMRPIGSPIMHRLRSGQMTIIKPKVDTIELPGSLGGCMRLTQTVNGQPLQHRLDQPNLIRTNLTATNYRIAKRPELEQTRRAQTAVCQQLPEQPTLPNDLGRKGVRTCKGVRTYKHGWISPINLSWRRSKKTCNVST